MTPTRVTDRGSRIAERKEFAGMKVTRIAPEDPDAVRARDDARLDGIGEGTDPIAYLGEPSE